MTSQDRGVLCALITVSMWGCSSTTTPTNNSPDTGVDVAVDTAPPPDTAPPEDVAPEDVPVMPSGIGLACTSPGSSPFPPQRGTCNEGQLCLRPELGFGGGYCSNACTSRCPADSACEPFGQGFSICLLRCNANSDCRGMEGYVCSRGSGTVRVCRPNDAPVGTRDDGAACYTTTAGDHMLAALPRTTFTGPNLPVSNRRDSMYEAEGNLAIHPTTGAIAGTYIAIGRSAFMGSSRLVGGAFLADGLVSDPLGSASDPVLDYNRDGLLRMTFIGLARTGTGVSQSHVRYVESRDNGMSWSQPAQVDPDGTCPMNSVCDKPWIISGPNPTAGGPDLMYISYETPVRGMGAQLVVQRSENAGRAWLPPVTLAVTALVSGSPVQPNLVQLAINQTGVLGASWAGITAGGDGGSARFGTSGNRVMFRRSIDGGRSFEGTRVVSRLSDSPVYVQPPVAMDGNTVFVAYPSGTANGAWDLVLATSTDGGLSWHYRKVNDDPETCATHAFPAMVVDTTTHDVHLIWLENRFGDGQVAYTHCPADFNMPCARNEAVSDRTFTFTTNRNPNVWHGDYLGLALSPGGDLVATWSDTRMGGPHMYFARGRSRP